MSFDWAQYLDLSQSLVDSVDGSTLDEAKLRCAISRAYYAAFCSARNFLVASDSRLGEGMGHTEVRREFQLRRGRAGRFVARTLVEMAIRREDADYRNSYPHFDLKGHAGRSLADAKIVIESIARLAN